MLDILVKNKHWVLNGNSQKSLLIVGFIRLALKRLGDLSSGLTDCLRNHVVSPFLSPIRINKKAPFKEAFLLMVPLIRIGLTTPSLPMTCSTTELQRHLIIESAFCFCLMSRTSIPVTCLRHLSSMRSLPLPCFAKMFRRTCRQK